MAKIKQIGKKMFAVVHETTGAVLKRGGKRVIHATKAAAQKDARATRRRGMGR